MLKRQTSFWIETNKIKRNINIFNPVRTLLFDVVFVVDKKVSFKFNVARL